MQTTKNRKFPLGNSLLYISFLSVAFGRVRPGGHTLFLFYTLIEKTSFHTANHFIYLVIARYRLLQRASHNLAGSWIEH